MKSVGTKIDVREKMHLMFFTRWIEQASTHRGWECRLHIVGKVLWLVYFVKSYRNCRNVSFLIREMNEPVMAIQATLLLKSNYNFRVKYALTNFLHCIVHIVWKQSIFELISWLYTSVTLAVATWKKPLCSSLEFHTHLGANSEDSFKMFLTSVLPVFYKCFTSV